MKNKYISAQFIILFAFYLFVTGCGTKYDYPFQNPKLSFEERAKDLVSRLSLEEKIAQMMHDAPAVEHLGIPAYNWWNDCTHGVGQLGGWQPKYGYKVTVYPQGIGMAAGWDTEAMHLMADYTAEEGRAVYNMNPYVGLTFWTPNINIFRDPRWGRGQETYGEDPFLTASLGKAFVHGLQGDDPRYLKTAACAKHFAVHSGPESKRHIFDVSVSSYDLWDTYLPHFQALVCDAEVAGVMCAYNAFDGQPCCGSDKLMIDILRENWKFTGYVTSDCWAIDDFYKGHKTHPDAPSAATDAVFHGTDIECGETVYQGLLQAVNEHFITEAQLDVSLIRLFTIRMRLGMFDPAEKVPYSGIDSTVLACSKHKEQALKMAHQSIVLLKNDGTLPLKKENLKKVAVVGPNVDNEDVQLGNYSGIPTEIITPLKGLKAKLPGVELICEPGCNYTDLDSMKTLQATATKVKDADVILFIGGITPKLEGEELKVNKPGFSGGDRTSILLPKVQTDLLKVLKATGKPVVLVLMSGSAVAVPWESENLNAIVETWYGGEFVGKALADVLFGDYNPSGHLPVTFYASDADLPDFEDYAMTNRTYKYFNGKPLYPFGYGLSYTEFACEWATQPQKEYKTGDTIQCAVTVKNIGSVAGDAVSQVYIKYPQDGKVLPLKELRTFERKTLQQGENDVMNVSIPIRQLAKWDDTTGQLLVPTGKYTIFAGSHSADEAVIATFEIK
jgi:beta-glucosidase